MEPSFSVCVPGMKSPPGGPIPFPTIAPIYSGLESPSPMPSSFQDLCRLLSPWFSKACLHIHTITLGSIPGEHLRTQGKQVIAVG